MVEPESSDKYTEMSQRYIRQAEEEFQKGDLTQASEKAWGAVALGIKSIAVQRGWRHHRHDLLYDISAQITAELGRPDLGRLFRSAGAMHTNFYEEWMEEDYVRGGIDDARIYLQELEGVQAAPPPTFVPQTPAQAARLRMLTGAP